MAGVLPNVLLITADQLRYDCVGYSGQYPVKTPFLDQFAVESVSFTNAYSHIPVCCPARQSLLHGKRPESFGALWNYDGALPVATLQPDAYTWTRTLAEKGYASAYLGKWGVHPQHDARSFGYDSYLGVESYKTFVNDLYPDVRYTNGFFGEANPIPVEDSETHWFAKRAVEKLEELQAVGRPWHMALHFSEPHLPCRPSGRFADLYDPASVPEWKGYQETFADKPYIQRQQLYNWGIEHYAWENWAPIVARYYGIISQLDEAVGLVLQALDRMGTAGETIVIFTSDHGDMCGSHRMMDKHYILYDDVIRVPLIIRWPGRLQAGTRLDHFVYNFLDLPPTLLEWLDLADVPSGHWHGRSLVPLFSGTDKPADWRDSVVCTYNGQQFGLYTQRMIRTNRWKYIWNLTDTDELYDLDDDPAELTNLIGNPQTAGIVSELRLQLHDRLDRDGDGLVRNEWMRRQLLNGSKLVR